MKIRIEDEDGDDCRLLRGGVHYMSTPNLKGGFDSNGTVDAVRPQYGFRVVFDAGLAVPPGRTNRGSMSGEEGAFAAVAGTEEEQPHSSHWSIGIRLAKEST